MEAESFHVVLGAILALLGAALVTYWEQLSAKKHRAITDAELASARVFSCVTKLVQIRAWLRVVKRSVDECFEEANTPEMESMDPGIKVLPFVGSWAPVEAFSSSELALALGSGDSGLVEKLLNVRSNYEATFALVQAFTVNRKEFSSFMRDSAIAGIFRDGISAEVELDPSKQHAHDARVADLNQLVDEIIRSVENDLPDVEKVALRYVTAMRSKGGLTVPNLAFQ